MFPSRLPDDVTSSIIRFNINEDRISFQACNINNARFSQTKSGTLQFTRFSSTRRLCSDANDQEVIKALNSAKSV